jgi:hypothetical protein
MSAMAGTQNPALTETQQTAREQLRTIAGELEAIRFRLLGVRSSLSVPAEEEVMLLGERDMDFSTEVRTVIECVVHDWIEAAVRDLRSAAEYVVEEEGR